MAYLKDKFKSFVKDENGDIVQTVIIVAIFAVATLAIGGKIVMSLQNKADDIVDTIDAS